MTNTVAALDRLAAAGYQSTRAREGCARCRFSEVEEIGGSKVYYCQPKHAEVTATGHCRDFVSVDTEQHEIAFTQSDMREVATIVGIASVYQLVRGWGGRRLHIPKAFDSRHPLVLSLGPNAAERLIRNLGGQYLELPTDVNVWQQKRDEAIVADLDRGHSLQECADRYGLTRQGIRAIVSRMRGSDVATAA